MGCVGAKADGGGPSDMRNWSEVKDSPLSSAEILGRTVLDKTTISFPDRQFDAGVVCFRGYYPESPHKPNQDAYSLLTPDDMGESTKAIFGVYDGHGQFGDLCAKYAATEIPKSAVTKLKDVDDMSKIQMELSSGFTEVNVNLHKSRTDDTLSGSTAVMAMLVKDTFYVANVGDSRCIVVGRDDKVTPLSIDQTPYRRDERARVRKTGARVMNMDQLEGHEPIHDDWDMQLGEEVDEDGDPPRIWSPDGPYPGTAFTRSIGDSVAEALGVCAEPEILAHPISEDDMVLIVASDGVWEFLTNKQVVALLRRSKTPLEAAQVIWRASYLEWITKEVRTDDITVIVVDIGGFFEGSTAGMSAGVSRPKPKVERAAPAAPPKPKVTRRGSIGQMTGQYQAPAGWQEEN